MLVDKTLSRSKDHLVVFQKAANSLMKPASLTGALAPMVGTLVLIIQWFPPYLRLHFLQLQVPLKGPKAGDLPSDMATRPTAVAWHLPGHSAYRIHLPSCHRMGIWASHVSQEEG